MRVLVIGPSIERTKGGMATVLLGILNDKRLNNEHLLKYVISHVEGVFLEKIFYIFKVAEYMLMKKNTYDIIHIHMASNASFYRKMIFICLGRLMNKRIIIHIHGADFDDFYRRSSNFFKEIFKFTIKLCSKVIVLSNYWKDFFVDNNLSNNVEVLNNAVDVNSYINCINSKNEFREFLFLGRLGKRKGIYDLLDAIDQIVNKLRVNDLVFYLAGDGDVNDISNIKAYVEKHDLSNNIIILGWVCNEKLKNILRCVETVVLPSYDEGLPMSILEGMASGKVIISTFVGGIPDLIEQGKNGFLLVPGDIPKLTEYILKVRNEKDDMQKVCESNIKKIQREYDIKEINKKLSQIYNSLGAL